VVKIRDVLLVATTGYASAPRQAQEDPAQSPVDERVDLHPALNLYADRNTPDFSKLVMDACDPGATRHRLWGSTWGFYRDDPPQACDGGLKWDFDRALYSAVALSRLLHPNTINTEYAARIEEYDGQETSIIAGPVRGYSAQAFAHRSSGRVWLSKGDAQELSVLFQRYWDEKDLLPEKVRRALWNHDYAMYVYDANIRFMVVATALEGLVHTDRHWSTRQFRRISRLARDVGLHFTEPEADDAYDMRSTVAHGSFFGAPAVVPDRYSPHQIEALLIRLEELLRVALRRAVENTTFRVIFSTDDTVRAHWPL
jgi:hypothetical protein